MRTRSLTYVVLLVLLGSTRLFAQSPVYGQTNQLQAPVATLPDSVYQPYLKQYNNSISADSKKDFWYFVGQVGSVLENSATGISLNPRLDQIGFNKGDIVKKFQINVTPVTKSNNFFKYDSLGFGLTFAAINNFTQRGWKDKVASNKDIQRYMTVSDCFITVKDTTGFKYSDKQAAVNDLKKYDDLLTSIFKRLPAGNINQQDILALPVDIKYALLYTIYKETKGVSETAKADKNAGEIIKNAGTGNESYDIIFPIPAQATPDVEKALNAALLDELTSAAKGLKDITTEFINKKPQLNFTASGMQNFLNNRLQGWYFGVNYTNYFGIENKLSWTAKATYSFEMDTTGKHQNFSRSLFKPSMTLDWLSPHWNSKLTSGSPLELKASFEGDFITSGTRYVNLKNIQEKTFTPVASLGITLNATDKVSFPFTIKYVDSPQKANLFGFLSVQYALDSSKPQ